MKYFNIKRYKFTTLQKNFDKLLFYFLNLFKKYNLRKFILRLSHKYSNLINLNINLGNLKIKNVTRKLNLFILRLSHKYSNLRNLNINLRNLKIKNVTRKLNLKSYKYLPIYFILSGIVLSFVYVIIPLFFSYDKSILDNTFCENKAVQCNIKGKVKYSFYPTPRILITNLVINDSSHGIDNFISAKNTSLILPFENLLNSKKINIKKIKLNDFKINFNLEKAKQYNDKFRLIKNLVPIIFTKGEIVFFDEKTHVATISDVRIKFDFTNSMNKGILKGKFLNDDININLEVEKLNNKNFTTLVFKLLKSNIYTKATYTQNINSNIIKDGNILIENKKNKLKAIFDYKDEKITITKSNLRNGIIDGKLEGIIDLSPYFNFNLDLSLNSLNFTKLYRHLLTLDHKKLFEINKKINGNLNLSSSKIYSGTGLFKSFESRLEFKNGDIVVKQFLLNMGKVGAADLLGSVVNDKNYRNLKFESNIYVDNQKKFLSKFGIYNKKKVPSNLFVSGNFDLKKLKIAFYEISGEEKLKINDIAFIEDEFNTFMLESGIKSFFNFLKFKDFLKSTITEIN